MAEDVRITGPAPGSIPVAEVAAPAVAPVLAEVAPVVEVAAPAPEVMPTAEPTLFEAAEARAAEAAKPKEVVAEAKPVAEGEPKVDDKPAAEEKPTEKPPEEKPAVEEKPATEAPKVDAAPVEPKPIPFEYKLPENVVLPEKMAGELHTALTNFAANPGDKNTQQALIDLHYSSLVEGIKEYNKLAHKSFADKRQEWQRAVMNHPELGGGNHDGAMQAIAYVRDNFASSHPRGSKGYVADMKALDEWMHLTGAGDNPAFLQWAHNISVRLNEPQIQATQEIKPIIQQDNGGRPSIYKHPTSFPRR